MKNEKRDGRFGVLSSLFNVYLLQESHSLGGFYTFPAQNININSPPSPELSNDTKSRVKEVGCRKNNNNNNPTLKHHTDFIWQKMLKNERKNV